MHERAPTLTDSGEAPRPSTVPQAQLITLARAERALYAIEGELARGGRGRIRRARDRRTDRVVAVKEPIDERPETRARFAREALVTARLQHPSIIPVYEAGTFEDGGLFYAMKLVEGGTLREAIESARTPGDRLALLGHVIAVADAIAYAHGAGVIHRDLKPSNVLCGPFGETVVVDWGLARVRDAPPAPAGAFEIAAQALTLDGAVVGTPAYMPPEQARGEELDERADVYAIGAILYHLLAGKAPFEGASSDEVLERVLAGPAPPLSREAAPEDLAAIVRRAMARDRDERYPSAAELALDLRRYTTGHLVSAHDYSPSARALRWLRRHRDAARLGAASLLLFAVLGSLAIARILRERDTAEALADALTLQQARAVLDRDPAAAIAWLKTYPERGAEWPQARALAIDAESRTPARHIFRHEGGVRAIALSPDGRLFATGGEDLLIAVHDTITGALRSREKLAAPATVMEFSPDGTTLAAIDFGGALHVFALANETWRHLELGHGPLFSLAFAPDGSAIAAGGEDGVPLLIAGEATTALAGSGARITALAFAGGGLIGAGADGAVRRWELEGGAPPRVLARHEGAIFDMLVSKDRAISGGDDGVLRVTSLQTGVEERIVLGAPIVDLALSADGESVAAACRDKMVRIAKLDGSAPPRELEGLSSEAFAVELSRDGAHAAATGTDGSLLIWDLAGGSARPLLGHNTGHVYLAFTRDSALLASGGADGTARIWPIGQEGGRTFPTNTAPIYLALSPRGVLAAGCENGALAIVDRGAVRELARLDVYSALTFLGDETTLVAASWDRSIRAFDVTTGDARLLASDAGLVWSLAARGRSFAAVGADGIRLWDDLSRPPRRLEGHTADVRAVVFSPDGRRLYSGGSDQTLRVWELGDQAPESRVLAREGAEVYLLALSPDGRRAASVTLHGVTLWDASTWTPRRLETPGHVRWIAFSPDGRRLAATTTRAELPIWDVESGARRVFLGPASGSNKLAFTADGTRFASTGRDGIVRVFDVETGADRIAHRFEAMALDVAVQGSIIGASGMDRSLWIGSAEGEILKADPEQVQAWLRAATSARIDAAHEATTPTVSP